MTRLTLILLLILAGYSTRSQETDSTELLARRIADSAMADLKAKRDIAALPTSKGRYYISKIKFMNGDIKKQVFYGVDSARVFVFKDATEEILDTINATDIEFITFRENGRTGKIIGRSFAVGFVAGALPGYFSACEDCTEWDIGGIAKGAWWGLIGGVAVGAGGALISIFNNATVTVNGDLNLFRKKISKLKKYGTHRWRDY